MARKVKVLRADLLGNIVCTHDSVADAMKWVKANNEITLSDQSLRAMLMKAVASGRFSMWGCRWATENTTHRNLLKMEYIKEMAQANENTIYAYISGSIGKYKSLKELVEMFQATKIFTGKIATGMNAISKKMTESKGGGVEVYDTFVSRDMKDIKDYVVKLKITLFNTPIQSYEITESTNGDFSKSINLYRSVMDYCNHQEMPNKIRTKFIKTIMAVRGDKPTLFDGKYWYTETYASVAKIAIAHLEPKDMRVVAVQVMGAEPIFSHEKKLDDVETYLIENFGSTISIRTVKKDLRAAITNCSIYCGSYWSFHRDTNSFIEMVEAEMIIDSDPDSDIYAYHDEMIQKIFNDRHLKKVYADMYSNKEEEVDELAVDEDALKPLLHRVTNKSSKILNTYTSLMGCAEDLHIKINEIREYLDSGESLNGSHTYLIWVKNYDKLKELQQKAIDNQIPIDVWEKQSLSQSVKAIDDFYYNNPQAKGAPDTTVGAVVNGDGYIEFPEIWKKDNARTERSYNRSEPTSKGGILPFTGRSINDQNESSGRREDGFKVEPQLCNVPVILYHYGEAMEIFSTMEEISDQLDFSVEELVYHILKKTVFDGRDSYGFGIR